MKIYSWVSFVVFFLSFPLSGHAEFNQCVFGKDLDEMSRMKDLYLVKERVIRSGFFTGLGFFSGDDEARLKLLPGSSEFSSVKAIINNTDDKQFLVKEIKDLLHEKRYVLYEGIKKGKVFGAIFEGKGEEIVSLIEDRMIKECEVFVQNYAGLSFYVEEPVDSDIFGEDDTPLVRSPHCFFGDNLIQFARMRRFYFYDDKKTIYEYPNKKVIWTEQSFSDGQTGKKYLIELKKYGINPIIGVIRSTVYPYSEVARIEGGVFTDCEPKPHEADEVVEYDEEVRR